MRYWRLSREAMLQTLRDPDRVLPSVEGRFNAWKTTEVGEMRMEYDPEADALFIELVEDTPADSRDYEEGVTAILNAAGEILALEILDVRRRLRDGAALSDALDVLAPQWSKAS
jgi:uncharacterized protein YuzE